MSFISNKHIGKENKKRKDEDNYSKKLIFQVGPQSNAYNNMQQYERKESTQKS